MLNQGPAVGPPYNTTQNKTTLHAECKYRAEYWTHHDDVIKWKHFRVTGHLCGEFTGDRWIPHTKASDCMGALMFSLICVWINGWVNNGEAGDLRRDRVHYDVTVMQSHPTTHTRGPHMRFLWWAFGKKIPRDCYNDCTHGTTHQIISFPSANCESCTKPILEPVSYHVYKWQVSAWLGCGDTCQIPTWYTYKNWPWSKGFK